MYKQGQQSNSRVFSVRSIRLLILLLLLSISSCVKPITPKRLHARRQASSSCPLLQRPSLPPSFSYIFFLSDTLHLLPVCFYQLAMQSSSPPSLPPLLPPPSPLNDVTPPSLSSHPPLLPSFPPSLLQSLLLKSPSAPSPRS